MSNITKETVTYVSRVIAHESARKGAAAAAAGLLIAAISEALWPTAS